MRMKPSGAVESFKGQRSKVDAIIWLISCCHFGVVLTMDMLTGYAHCLVAALSYMCWRGLVSLVECDMLTALLQPSLTCVGVDWFPLLNVTCSLPCCSPLLHMLV